MRTVWMIDAVLFPHYRDELVREIEDQGHHPFLIEGPKPGYRWNDLGTSKLKTPDDRVVVHGDIDLVRTIQEQGRCDVVAPATIQNYECASYFCELGEYLLNRNYCMLPFGELERRREFLFATFGVGDAIFVRPNSPLKIFTGQLVTRGAFADHMELMGFYEFPRSEIVVVSSPWSLVAEWRFVVVEGRVIAGSQYRRANTAALEPCQNTGAKAFADRIVSTGFEPDPVWVFDVCQTDDGEFHLLEIGVFAFADLYACDKTAIVRCVSAVGSLS